MRYFLDACALIALANDELGAEKVEDIISDNECFVHSINVYELYKDSKRRNNGSHESAEEFLADLAELGVITSVDMDRETMRDAADLKEQQGGKIAIPDVIALSASRRAQATFLTSDATELGPLAANGYAIEFFRRGPNEGQ